MGEFRQQLIQQQQQQQPNKEERLTLTEQLFTERLEDMEINTTGTRGIKRHTMDQRHT